MCVLVRLGVVLMVYGCLMHSWHSVLTILLSNILLFVGGVLFLSGDKIESLLKKYWPSVEW